MVSAEAAVALTAIGFGIGAYSTAIGAGGGFLIAPLLLIRYGGADPAAITTASLTVVSVQSVAASATAAREGRVDSRLALAMAAIAVPAGLLGGVTTAAVPREVFAIGFAVLLASLAVYLLLRPTAPVVEPMRRVWRRTLVDRRGQVFSYGVPVRRSVLPNAAMAYLAALAGIGGGPIGVPLMTRIMRVPHAIAVPSIHLLIAIQSLAVVALHLALRHAGEPMADVPWLALGVLLANPVGQALRRRLGEGPLTRALALGLMAVAVRTAFANGV